MILTPMGHASNHARAHAGFIDTGGTAFAANVAQHAHTGASTAHDNGEAGQTTRNDAIDGGR